MLWLCTDQLGATGVQGPCLCFLLACLLGVHRCGTTSPQRRAHASPHSVHTAPAPSTLVLVLIRPHCQGSWLRPLSCSAAARTVTFPHSYPVCTEAATSLCPSTRAAVNSREAAWRLAWDPQVRRPMGPEGKGGAARATAALPGDNHPPCISVQQLWKPWRIAREASRGGGRCEAGCPLGLHVMVIVLIPARQADRRQRAAPVWLLLGWAWSVRGQPPPPHRAGTGKGLPELRNNAHLPPNPQGMLAWSCSSGVLGGK